MTAMAEKSKTTSSAGKRTASSDRRSTGKTASDRRATSKAPARRPIRREVGAVVCLLLALFGFLGYFGVEAIFIDWWCGLLKGLLGYGFWAAPPMLVVGAYILAFHRGRPVRLRLTCALLTPLFLGAIFHLLLCGEWVLYTETPLPNLWDSGRSLASGGVLAGLLGGELALVFSKIGALILLIVLQALLILGAFHLSVQDLMDRFRARPRPQYERKPDPVKPAPAEKAAPAGEKKRPAGPIDIPVDEPPAQEEAAGDKPRRKFFERKAAVTPPEPLHPTGEALSSPADTPVEVLPRGEGDGEEVDLVAAFQRKPLRFAEPAPDVPPPPEPAPSQDLPPMPEIQREPAVEKVTAKETRQAAAQITQDIEQAAPAPAAYQYPPVSLLVEGGGETTTGVQAELKQNQDRLSDTIRSFGVEAHMVNVVRGPSVTRYEMELEQGVKLNKLTNLADDIALALGATGVRIAPIPEKISTVGIEVPNKLVSPVHIHEVIDSNAFKNSASKVSFAVGKDIGGNCIVGNIAKLPHLLIAGTTGSGKSVCTNSLIVSLLYKATPEEVRLIMVDPKMVELGIYNGIPHLLIPVVTDPKKAAGALQWAVVEMMKRYRAFSEIGVRDLAAYNAHAAKTEGMEKMPQIVVVIDELADLMLVAAKEVEDSICRVAQMGRAAGMHLVIATQRPSSDVITGLMKANIPSRIAFAVASALESRIILDTQGAEKLVGRGDMLYFPLGSGKPTRVQGCLISDEEVAAVVEFVKQGAQADYDEEIIHQIEQNAAEKEKGSKGVGGSAPDEVADDADELLPAAIEVVVETGMASVSMLQRRLKLGYARAARLVDQMEEKGVVGPFEGSKPRQVLITKEQWQEMQFKQGMVDRAPEPVPEELDFEGDAIPQDRDMPPFDIGEEGP